jgi:hypothetical protein
MRYLLMALACCVLTAGLARADTTGSISGIVFDQGGQPAAGVIVRVSGDPMPAGRTVTTGGDGSYRFLSLLPGTYTVETLKDGQATAKRMVRVEVGKDTQTDMVFGMEIKEAITVSAALPVIDTKSTEVNINYSSDAIKDLPIARSYSGLFQLVPGVADNRSSIGPSAGGSRQDNTYLIDGVNITNPGFGYLTTEVNELDIAEFNVKRGGITAEFGRSAGVVTNAVSKSGTNTFSGSARILFQPLSFMAKPNDAAFGVSRSDTFNPAFAAGGPLLRDKIFFYGSIQYFKTSVPGRVNKYNTPLPDAVGSGEEYYGKITAMPTQSHLLSVAYRYRPSKAEGQSVGSSTAPTVATATNTTTQVATVSWSWFPASHTTVDARFLYLKDKNANEPVTKLGYLPTFDINNLPAMGQYTDPDQANLDVGGYQYTGYANYTRQEMKATLSQYFDLGKTGHQVKVGAGYEFGEEEFNRLTNGWGQISRISGTTPYYRARYYFEQPAQFGQGRTWSIFAQDAITFGARVTANLGVLLNRDDFAQDLPGSSGCLQPLNTWNGQPGGAAVFETKGDRCTFMRFGFFDEVQPRLGLNYVVREGKPDKVYVNWGRFYNMDQKSSGRSLAPRRIYQREARYNVATGALISDLPRASTSTKQIDTDLKPTYNDEWLAGYAMQFGGMWSAELFYIYRNTKHFIEDTPSTLPSTGPYAAANLPCTRYQGCVGGDAKRKYQAMTLEVGRRMANQWSANVSYTWSRLEGNFDLDYSGDAVFNTSSFIQDGPGTFVQDPYRYGPLRQDRPHVFKVFANWAATTNFMLGGYLRAQSGTPWNARGQDSQGGAALYYLEQAGSHRNPTWTNFDLLASYRFKLGGRTNLGLEARILNLFGNQTKVSTDSVKFTDYLGLSTPPYIAPGTILNPFFQLGNSYAPGRRFVLAARLDF